MFISSPKFWLQGSEVTLLLDFWVNGKTMTWQDTSNLSEDWHTTSALLNPSTIWLETLYMLLSTLYSCYLHAPSSQEFGSTFPAHLQEMLPGNSSKTTWLSRVKDKTPWSRSWIVTSLLPPNSEVFASALFLSLPTSSELLVQVPVSFWLSQSFRNISNKLPRREKQDQTHLFSEKVTVFDTFLD